jgi:alkylated DNA repair dioxygenase AlkB
MMDLFDPTGTLRPPFDLPEGLGAKVSWSEADNGFWIELPRGRLFYSAQFFDRRSSDRCLDYMLANDTTDWRKAHWREYQHEALSQVKFKHIDWQHDKIFIYGQYRYQPRYTAWHGDSDAEYSYSGIHLEPKPWNPCLEFIRERIQHVANDRFNAVLLNWYRDGEDAMGWHSDNEKELGSKPTIASVSFGAERDFHLRSNDRRWKLSIPLEHGSLLLMQGEMQQHWQHALPKRLRIKESRVNLTFRQIYPARIT